MKYAAVQKLIETFVQQNWTQTNLSFENVPFNSELYTEFARLTVQFGDSVMRSLGANCYRTAGVVFFDVYVKPGIGVNRLVTLADAGITMLVNRILTPAQPDGTPAVHLLEPSLSKNLAERTGWISAQLTTSFYFDTEN